MFSLYEWIDVLTDVSDPDRDAMKHGANIFCALGECFFRRPVSLQQVREKIYDMLDDLPTPDGMNDGDRLLVKDVINVVCTTVECLYKKPVDLYPVWEATAGLYRQHHVGLH